MVTPLSNAKIVHSGLHELKMVNSSKTKRIQAVSIYLLNLALLKVGWIPCSLAFPSLLDDLEGERGEKGRAEKKQEGAAGDLATREVSSTTRTPTYKWMQLYFPNKNQVVSVSRLLLSSPSTRVPSFHLSSLTTAALQPTVLPFISLFLLLLSWKHHPLLLLS